MTKRDDAAYYQRHKDDPKEYGDPEGVMGKRPERRRLNAMVSVRLTPEEEGAIRAAAEKQDVSVSAFLRSAGLRATVTVPSLDADARTYSRSTTGSGTAHIQTPAWDLQSSSAIADRRA